MERLELALCAVALAVLVAWLAAVAARPLGTDDLWWHLKMGEVYATEGLWPQADPLLHTSGDRRPVQHEWLFDVIVHGLQRALGFQGLRVVHLGALLGIIALVGATFHSRSPSVAMTIVATMAFTAVSWWRLIQFRPDLVTIPATVAFYRLVLAPRAGPSWGRVAAAVALVLAWADVHSLFGVALALGIAALAGLALEAWPGPKTAGAPRSGQSPGRVGLAILLATLASLVNPRGLDQLLTFYSSSTDSAIWLVRDEWAHFDPFAPPGPDVLGVTRFVWSVANAIFFSFVVVALLGLVDLLRGRSRGARRFDPVLLSLAGAGAVAMLVSVRFVWMSFFSLLFLLDVLRRRQTAPRRSRYRAWISVGLAWSLVIGFARQDVLTGLRQEVGREPEGYFRTAFLTRRYAAAGVQFIADAGLEGNLFNPYHVGGYAGYWLAPKVRTFIDGRTEHYPPEVARDYLAIISGETAHERRVSLSLLEEYDVDLFLGSMLPAGNAGWRETSESVASSPLWVPLFRSSDHVVYGRRGSGNSNMARVESYYQARGVPFDRKRGFDTSAVVRDAPAWAIEVRLLPRDYEAIRARAESDDRGLRARALSQLGRLYWRLELYERQMSADSEALAIDPGAVECRLRLGEGQLRRGNLEEALALARDGLALDPEHEDLLRLLDATNTRRSSPDHRSP